MFALMRILDHSPLCPGTYLVLVFSIAQISPIVFFQHGFFEVPDRREAISTALQTAANDDCVLVSGMGSLKTRNMNGEEIPWNDKQVISEVFASLHMNVVKKDLDELKKEIEDKS